MSGSKALEIPRRFEDAEPRLGDFASLHEQRKRAFTFDTGQFVDADARFAGIERQMPLVVHEVSRRASVTPSRGLSGRGG